MFGFLGGKGNRFDPSLHRFPDINVDTVSKRLRLVNRGAEDGRKGIPAQNKTSFTKTELDAIAQIESLRKEALNNFDEELRSYKNRVSEARSDTSSIKLKIAAAASALERLEGEYGNHLETALVRVKESQEKLDAFKLRHGVIGPPKHRSNIFLTISFITFMLLIESILNAQFFAKRNDMGLVGGVLQAGMISALNVFIGYLAGVFGRYKNLRSFSNKLLGNGSILAWIMLAILFNFAVAHFRDALEGHVWEEALKLAVSDIAARPFGLASLDSWILLMIGGVVTLSSFLKGYHSADRVPIYNDLWDSVEQSIQRYADQYGHAHDYLDSTFKEMILDLRSEVDSRRANLRSAVDALDSKGSLLDGLRVFLRTTNGAVNQLLMQYREANGASRSDPTPAYFNETFSFGDNDIPDRKVEELNVEFVEVEIAKMGLLVDVGVNKLTAAQRRSLLAFPTVQDIKAGRHDRQVEKDQYRFRTSMAELEEMFATEKADPIHHSQMYDRGEKSSHSASPSVAAEEASIESGTKRKPAARKKSAKRGAAEVEETKIVDPNVPLDGIQKNGLLGQEPNPDEANK